MIPGSFASPEAIAHIMTQKFVMVNPLYWQEQEWARQGLKLSRQNMSNSVVPEFDLRAGRGIGPLAEDQKLLPKIVLVDAGGGQQISLPRAALGEQVGGEFFGQPDSLPQLHCHTLLLSSGLSCSRWQGVRFRSKVCRCGRRIFPRSGRGYNATHRHRHRPHPTPNRA